MLLLLGGAGGDPQQQPDEGSCPVVLPGDRTSPGFQPTGPMVCCACLATVLGGCSLLNSGEPKCVGAKKLIREPPQSNHIHPSKRTNVV